MHWKGGFCTITVQIRPTHSAKISMIDYTVEKKLGFIHQTSHLNMRPKAIAAFFLTKTSIDYSAIRDACILILCTRLSDRYLFSSEQFASMQPAKKMELPDRFEEECSKYCPTASRY